MRYKNKDGIPCVFFIQKDLGKENQMKNSTLLTLFLGATCMTARITAADLNQIPTATQQIQDKSLWIYTGNADKQREFTAYFTHTPSPQENWRIHAPKTLLIEEDELYADYAIVAARKAYDVWDQTGGEYLVEDTSLGIEGFDENGVCIKWVQATIREHIALFIGRKAWFRVSIAQKQDRSIMVYTGLVEGTIVASRGNGGFGFDDFFQPDDQEQGDKYTLAEMKEREKNQLDAPHIWDRWNARYLAVQQYKSEQPDRMYRDKTIAAPPSPLWQEKDEQVWKEELKERLQKLQEK